MITYKSICNKDDKAFLKVARKVLRSDFDLAVDDARKAFQVACASESNPLHRVNAARKAANLEILKHLTEYGVTNWRELLDEKNQKAHSKVRQTPGVNTASPGKTASGVKKTGSWKGKSILDMSERASK